MFRIPFEWLEFALEWFESILNGSKLDSKASNPFLNCSNLVSKAWYLFQIVRINIRMLRISFEWFEFPFECFECLSNGSNVRSSASNPFRMVVI